MIVAFALLAMAASPEHVVRCDVVEGDKPVRHFSVTFKPDGDKLKSVKVDETDRIFTPGNAVATFRIGSGGSSMTSIPDKRPGKWSGVSRGGAFDFTLAARDGSATFTLTPDATKPGGYALIWSAMLDMGFDQQKGEGAGTCVDQGAAS